MKPLITETSLSEAKLLFKGKVRDVYEVEDKLLIFATDRISAFDSVLPEGIPYKGAVLNKLSEYWFSRTEKVVENHMVSTDVVDFPAQLRDQADVLEGRSMLVIKAKRIDVECVVRGYLSGSGWEEYKRTGSVCGVILPPGLKESDRLPEPIFTPAIKSDSGHDVNVSEKEISNFIGADLTSELREKSLRLYSEGARHAKSKGIIIADTKFEFGLVGGKVVLIDELLTPDSSRFWPEDDYSPGGQQPSFDKQFVRDYLKGIGWDREPPAPHLPAYVIEKTSKKYLEAYERITGRKLI